LFGTLKRIFRPGILKQVMFLPGRVKGVFNFNYITGAYLYFDQSIKFKGNAVGFLLIRFTAPGGVTYSREISTIKKPQAFCLVNLKFWYSINLGGDIYNWTSPLLP